MSLEVGGRADKYGNTYEDRHRATLLLKIATEELHSIRIEPLDNGRDIAEYLVTDCAGKHRYYQCKGSNGNNDSWSVADLNRHQVFTRAKDVLTRDPDAEYYFISPLGYKQLDELCKRARTNHGYEEFKNCQLMITDKNGTRPDSVMDRLFQSARESFGFAASPDDEQHTVELLARCFFERFGVSLEYQSAFEMDLDCFFAGNPSAIRSALENFAQETGLYGQDLTAHSIVDFLEKKGFYLRSRLVSTEILPRIKALNRDLWDDFSPIQGKLFHRTATDSIMRIIESGGSAVLYGIAGCGKSGCLEEVREELERRGILYLSLKLDKYPPTGTADAYGKSLDLLQSPIASLKQLSGNQPCILILDQLDCLRWSGKNSGTALNICKQLISQAAMFNTYDHAKISIIFSSRTVDLDNDKGLRQLFNSSCQPTLTWEKVEVPPLSEQELMQILGPIFTEMPPRLKRILAVPASLYVWLQLSPQKRSNMISSTFELMRTWWEDLLQQGRENSFSDAALCACKDTFVQRLEVSLSFKLPLSLFSDCRECIDFLISQGLLQKGSNDTVSFVHQSFWDYFVAEFLHKAVYRGEMLSSFVGPSHKQTPVLRYRLFMVLQNLFDSDEKLFLQQARILLDSSDVRYYIQCTVFDVIGQSKEVSPSLYQFIKRYMTSPEWEPYIIDAIFRGHLPFLKALEDFEHPNWSTSPYFSLLDSVTSTAPDFVIATISRYEPNDKASAYSFCRLLYCTLSTRSPTAISQCLHILHHFPDMWTSVSFITLLIESNAIEALVFLSALLTESPLDSKESVYFADEQALGLFAQSFYQQITTRLFPIIAFKATHFPQAYSQLGHTLEFSRYSSDPIQQDDSLLRKTINLIKKALSYWGVEEPESLLIFIKGHSAEEQTILSHELLMYAILCLPQEYADDAIEWLLTDFTNQVFNFTDDSTDYLSSTKQLIKKFSPNCSSVLFERLEYTICTWHDPTEQMIRAYKTRLQMRQNSSHEPIFYPYWGFLQKELLPTLNQARISPYAAALLRVLNRNRYICSPHYHHCILSGQCGACVSPVSGKHLRDSSWLKIISTPENNLSHIKPVFNGNHCIEASVYTFSNALGQAAQKEPQRFAQLLLQFPPNCPAAYCARILNALTDTSEDSLPAPALLFKVVHFLSARSEPEICLELLRFIAQHPALPWPPDIVDFIVQLALQHPDPSPTALEELDSSHQSPLNTLGTHSLNHVRSYALQTLTILCSKQSLAPTLIESTIQQALFDPSPCVLYALTSLIAVYYNTNAPFAVSSLKKLAKKNLLALCSRYPFSCWNILYNDFKADPRYYRQLIKRLCKSKATDIASIGASWLCALAVFHRDDELLSFLESSQFTENQQKYIIKQAVFCFQNPSHRALSKRILLQFFSSSPQYTISAVSLLENHCLSVTEDQDLLSLVLNSCSNELSVEHILSYLYDSDCDLYAYLPALKFIAASIDPSKFFIQENLILTLIRCINRIFSDAIDSESDKV